MKTARDLMIRNLKRLRESADFDQDDLAEAAGLSKGMIAKLEQGKAAPSPETLDKLVAGLKTTHAQLFVDANEAPVSAKTVGEMSPADLEALVARAAKRDGTINLEIEKLRRENDALRAQVNSLPPDFWSAWSIVKSPLREVFLFLATGNAQLYINRSAVPASLSRLLKNLRNDLGSD